MRQIRVDTRRQPDNERRSLPRSAAPPQHKLTPRCNRHPGVHMVLAGHNPQWHTVRYLCPMCSALGLPPVEIAVGVVSQYVPHRGYGFIANGGPRIFFHISDLVSPFTPHVGQAVTCHVEQNARGLLGKHVKPQ